MQKSRPLSQELIVVGKRGFILLLTNGRRAFARYNEINGEQCAASFAYYAFFSLFPLILLMVAIGTCFFPNRSEAAYRVVTIVETYTPLLEKDKALLASTVDGVLKHGIGAGLLGILALTWSSLRFFQALVIGVNRAWDQKDYGWWRLPLRNLLMIGFLASAGGLGVIAPAILKAVGDIKGWDLGLFTGLLAAILPSAILFYGLLMFYKFAPRHPAKIRHVWMAALVVAILLKVAQIVFAWYLGSFGNFNALYGVFGTIMGLMLWIYFNGVVIILGGCLSATKPSRFSLYPHRQPRPSAAGPA